MELEGKHVVVTGGASGIGRALCQRFAKEGTHGVVVADRDSDGAEQVAREVGGLAFAVNVAKEAEVKALVAAAEDEYGPVDLFVSNAGIGIPGDVFTPDDQWQLIWDVNVMAHIYAARAVLPGMLERGDGYLLSTASAAGLLAQIGSAPYSVTKHAAVALAEWIAITYGDRGIKVSVLCPQAVRTGMTGGSRNGGVAGVDGMMEPDEVAEVVLEALREERLLVLPHPEVAQYMQRKANDPDRWLAGMRRLQARFADPS